MIKNMVNERKRPFRWFVAGQIIVYSFITLLSFVEGVWFGVVLLLMHSGIILLIYSKRMFQKSQIEVKSYYHRVYRLLALFLIILVYKVGSRIFGYAIHVPIKTIATFSILMFVLVFAFQATKQLYQQLMSNSFSRSA